MGSSIIRYVYYQVYDGDDYCSVKLYLFKIEDGVGQLVGSFGNEKNIDAFFFCGGSNFKSVSCGKHNCVYEQDISLLGVL